MSYHVSVGDGVEFLYTYPFTGFLCDENNLNDSCSVISGELNCTSTCNGTSSGKKDTDKKRKYCAQDSIPFLDN